VGSFSTQNTVWFSFTAPDSRHVRIDGISSLDWPFGLDPLDIQLALYESDNNTCSGNLTEVGSRYQSNSLDESLDLNCLEPGRTYYIMVDGGSNDNLGVFELLVNDAGYDPIQTTLDTTVCFGQSVLIGNTLYNSFYPSPSRN